MRHLTGTLTKCFLLTAGALFLLPTSVSATEGRTPGAFAVSQTGSATYTIPIWAPPGPHGLQPHIALTYNSRTPNGIIGVGWSIAGLSAITRCVKTTAQDGTPAPILLVVGDGYCLDGNRLRLTSAAGTYGLDGSTYQTELANFTQVTAHLSAGNGPAYFVAKDRNAVQYIYGNGGNSQVLAPGTTTALSWQLNEVIDPAGNTMTISYNTGSGTAVPATISWAPTAHAATTYVNTMAFTYRTKLAQNSTYQYIGGVGISNPNLLAFITVSASSTTIKSYGFTYQASATTGQDTLTQLSECVSAGNNCLPATTFTYQSGQAGVGTTVSTVSSTSLIYDFNGDGLPDALYSNGTTLQVALNTGSGFGTPIDTHISATATYAVGDVLGAGYDAILASDGTTFLFYQYLSSTNTFSTGVDTHAPVTAGYTYQLSDITGDGLPDLVGFRNNSVSVQMDVNQSTGTTPNFSTSVYSFVITLPGGANGTLYFSRLYTGDPASGPATRAIDFNGDGRKDALLFVQSRKVISGEVNFFNYFYELISNGSSAAYTVVKLPFDASLDPFPVLGNFNDDQCTDAALGTTVYFSGCNGTVPSTVTLSGTTNIVAAMDWNGDGRTDIIAVNSGSTTISWYEANGTGFQPLQSTTANIPSVCSSGSQFVVIDADGDGLDDFGCMNGSSSIAYSLHNQPTTRPDLLSKVTDGYGNSASPTYVPLTHNNYSKYSDAPKGETNYIGPLYVVNQATFSDPSALPGATYNQAFWYYGAWANLQGRGFDSFYATRALDSRTGLYDYRYYERGFPETGMKVQDIVSNGSFYLSQWIANPAVTVLDNTPNNQRQFPYIANTTEYIKEIGGTENGDASKTITVGYTFDNYGNATVIDRVVTDTDPGSPYLNASFETKTTNTTDISVNPTADFAASCLSLLDETQVAYTSSLNSGQTITRTQTYTPDTIGLCRINTIVTEPSQPLYKVTESLTFDSFGNIATDTVTGNNMPSSPASRLTTLNWGTTGQFLTTRTDPSNATTTWTYASASSLGFGEPDSVRDPNGLTTSWGYDAIGRKSEEIRADSTVATWTYSACTSYCGFGNSVYQVAQTQLKSDGSTVIRTDTTLYDPIDRVTQISGPTVTGSTAVVQKTYNPTGTINTQSIPFISGAAVYQQSFQYDVLNRLTQASRPIRSTNLTLQSTNYSYAGRTNTVTDPYGNTKTIISDVNGWLRRTKDALGYTITNTYDPAGSMTGTTDSVGNTLLSGVTIAYGIQPFRTAAADADLGAWTSTIDSLGEKTSWTDAKGQSFSMSYDFLSRPLTRTEPDQFTQWTWGSTAASHNVGQLVSECTGSSGVCLSSAYLETRSFDAFGRLSTRSIAQGNNPGNNTGGTFLFTVGYDATTGFLNSLTYPISTSGFAFQLQYNYQNGLLLSVVDSTSADQGGTCGASCTLWTAQATNSFGQTTMDKLGNGVVRNRTYDPVTSWLSAATAGVGGGSAILNQSNTYDENGNLKLRQNSNGTGLNESFNYDADNRLTCVNLASICSGTSIVYDGGAAGAGNVTTQVGVGTYTYPAVGQPRPHAVSSITGTVNGITNPTFAYDANGNMTNRASTTANVGWYSYNYPASIAGTDATGNEQVTFLYGPDRQRWKQVYTGPSVTETTYYLDKLLEVVYSSSTMTYRHYVYAGHEPIAVYSRVNGGANTMNYVLGDHLGSVAAVTANTGAVTINESFSAFGTRRNPSTWSGAPTTQDLNTIAGLTRQGFSFQTALGQSMGLNHMNGRVQDAILARFLSPDPNVRDPTASQSYNRYSYVINNPLTEVDPTGFADDPQTSGTDNTLWDFASFGQETQCYGNCGFGPPTAYYAVDVPLSKWGFAPTNGSVAITGGNPQPSSPETSDTAIGGDMAQSQEAQAGTPGFGSNAAFAGASIDQVSEIDVTGQRTSNSPTISVGNMQIVLDRESYFHIFAFHAWWPITDKSRYYPAFRNVNSINKIFQQTIDSTIGFPQPNANYYFSANLGFSYGTDQSGNPTTWNTVVVEILTQPTVTTPGFGRVVTMFPGQ